MLASQPAADAAAATAAGAASNSSAAQQQRQGSEERQQHLKSRMLWARALTKSKAVVRLLQAGQQHSSGSLGQLLQQPAVETPANALKGDAAAGHLHGTIVQQ
jgi:hypothetical protein